MTIYVVYKHTNTINGKAYVGQVSKPTLLIEDPDQLVDIRWRQHCNAAKRKSSAAFHRAIRKYGEAAFEHEVLEVCDSLENCLTRESYWIKYHKTTTDESGYNMTTGGEGYYVTDEIRSKMRARGKEIMSRPDVLAKLSKPIAQIDPDTHNVLAIYSSARKASRITGVNHGNMCSAARNRSNQIIGGYLWKFIDKYSSIAPAGQQAIEKKDSRYRGSLCHQTKFSEDVVVELRKNFAHVDLSIRGAIMQFCSDQASKLGVSSRAIHNIVRYKTWKHVSVN